MSMKFDATLKGLSSAFPRDFLITFDPTASGPIQLLNVDLSTVTAAADLVVGIGQPLVEIVHIDFQSSADAKKHLDILAYNSLLFRTYQVPVHSIVVLLRRSAGHSNLNGAVCYSARPGRGRMDFTYEVIPLWDRPIEELLTGTLGALPLAMLGKLPKGADLVESLTSTARRIIERLEAEASAEQIKNLVAAAFLLTGLRVPRDVGRKVFLGVRAMRDSDTFMAILEEGQEKQARKDIQQLAQIKFGIGDEPTLACLEAISDLERLERIHKRLFEAITWQDLLDTP